MHDPRSAALKHRVAIAACAAAVLAAVPLTLAQEARSSATLNRIRDSGRIKLGYRVDARPFSYQNDSGQPAGFSTALCLKVADSVKSELKLSSLAVEWVPVAIDERFNAVQQGKIDLLCGADTVTLARRSEVSFSIPIFPGGVGAMVRADAPVRLREVLTGGGQTFRPIWRASAAAVLQAKTFTAVAGTTGERWLNDRIAELQVQADVSTVASYDGGVSRLLDRKSDVLFGERAILMDAVHRHAAARELAVIDREFSYEPLAFAMARGDDDFRLLVDRALSHFYRSGDLGTLYANTFGEPDGSAVTFYRWNALPD